MVVGVSHIPPIEILNQESTSLVYGASSNSHASLQESDTSPGQLGSYIPRAGHSRGCRGWSLHRGVGASLLVCWEEAVKGHGILTILVVFVGEGGP